MSRKQEIDDLISEIESCKINSNPGSIARIVSLICRALDKLNDIEGEKSRRSDWCK